MSEPSENPWQGRWWDLPPLILHPFERGLEMSAARDSIRLSLHLNGMGEADADKEPLLRGRYAEFRMLCLVGKDAMRWIMQCVDFSSRDGVLAGAGIRPQSFADLLVNRTPAAVGARFESWGVMDYRRILARAIGINAVFPKPPDYGVITSGFLEEYYAFADGLFVIHQRLAQFPRLEPESFGFSLYTSDEYLSTLACGLDDAPA